MYVTFDPILNLCGTEILFTVASEVKIITKLQLEKGNQ